jgi:hypothetical protein
VPLSTTVIYQESILKSRRACHHALALVNKMPEQAARFAAVLILVDTNLMATAVSLSAHPRSGRQ